MEKILQNIIPKTIGKTKNEKISNSEAYSQYLLMEIVNRAMTNILENGNSKKSK